VKDFLVALSFDEVYNYSFTGEQKEGTIKILNPISADLQYLRQNLKNGLLKNYEKNAPFYPSCRLFEIGKVFSQVGNEREQSDHLAGLIAEKSSDLFLLMKGIALAFFQKVNLDNNQLIFETEKIFCGTRNIGFWASLDEAIFFEIDLEKLFVCDKKKIFYQPIPAYPPIKRDLAFLIDKKIVWQEIYQKIKNFDPLIKDIDLFDVFEDAKFGEKRSLAFHLTYQSTERTLTALEVEEKQKKLIIHLNQVFKAELRNF
jgi:phenylalanyl-tRNA synthetase beta chain